MSKSSKTLTPKIPGTNVDAGVPTTLPKSSIAATEAKLKHGNKVMAAEERRRIDHPHDVGS